MNKISIYSFLIILNSFSYTQVNTETMRIINNKTPLFEQNKTKEMITKMKNYITNGLFYNFVDKNILKSDNNELIKTILEI